MKDNTFHVKAVWNEDAGVFHSDSNISGLHIEARNLEEFEAVMHETAPELVVENHIRPQDVLRNRISDLVPVIV